MPQGHRVLGLPLVAAVMRSCGRRSARLVARATQPFFVIIAVGALIVAAGDLAVSRRRPGVELAGAAARSSDSSEDLRHVH